jgi:hypothetical protein
MGRRRSRHRAGRSHPETGHPAGRRRHRRACSASSADGAPPGVAADVTGPDVPRPRRGPRSRRSRRRGRLLGPVRPGVPRESREGSDAAEWPGNQGRRTSSRIRAARCRLRHGEPPEAAPCLGRAARADREPAHPRRSHRPRPLPDRSGLPRNGGSPSNTTVDSTPSPPVSGNGTSSAAKSWNGTVGGSSSCCPVTCTGRPRAPWHEWWTRSRPEADASPCAARRGNATSRVRNERRSRRFATNGDGRGRRTNRSWRFTTNVGGHSP